MHILAVDTAAQSFSVALADDRNVIAEAHHANMREQAALLQPMISSLLQENQLNYQDIDLLAVTTGPGSFTGLRIGISTIRALSLALDDVPVIGVTAFELYVHGLLQMETPKSDQRILVALESFRKDLFFQVFDHIGQPQGDAFNCAPDEIETHISTDAGRNIIVTGNAIDKIKEPLWRAQFMDEEDMTESAASVAQIACERYELHNGKIESGPPSPFYLRAPDVSQPKAS